MRPYVYASVSSNSSYDIMVSDGQRERRVARIKVDSVFFGNLSARLSTDGTTTAFRVSGDRQGGSAFYSVDVSSGKYTQVAQAPNASEAIGTYVWSPAGNTLAFTRSSPAPDPAKVDSAYGTVYIYSVGFKAARLASSDGNDRVISFSADGLGVYAARRDSANPALEHLVYLPLSGGEAQFIFRSQPALRFSNYRIWAPTLGRTRFAFLADGNFSLAAQNYTAPAPRQIPQTVYTTDGTPLPLPSVTPASRVAVTGKLSGPNGYGVGVLYGGVTVPALLTRDAEAFPLLTWTDDGSALLMGGTRSGNSWLLGMGGDKRAVSINLKDLSPATWSLSGKEVVLADSPTTRLVTLNTTTAGLAATRYVGITPKAGAAAVKLPVPYIHQVKDTAENGDGNWACGPTSIAMSLAYFCRIDPWPVTIAAEKLAAAPSGTSVAPLVTSTPAPPVTPKPVTGADYGPYVTNKYTAFGHTYASTSLDPRGNALAGLYGTICPGGYASWSEMSTVLGWHNLQSGFVSLTWDGIVGALKRGHPVILGNELTTEGHIILVIGYTNDGNLIVNDPYGNRFAPGYGSNDGRGVLYPWKLATPRHALEVIGTVPPPTATPTKTATPTRTVTLTAVPTATVTVTSTP